VQYGINFRGRFDFINRVHRSDQNVVLVTKLYTNPSLGFIYMQQRSSTMSMASNLHVNETGGTVTVL
jgi:hypothetical protein